MTSRLLVPIIEADFMDKYDLIVVGGGISGLSLAHYAARAGLRPLVLEKEERAGGCFYSHRLPGGFRLELGAHTCYNSYRNLINIIEDMGMLEKIQARRKVPFRLLVDGRVKSIPSEMNLVELLRSAPRIFTEKKAGRTVESYYSRIAGRGNYRRVIGPALSAVPSQRADEFPAEMLFKKRPRRKDIIKKFTFEGGLQGITDAISASSGIEFASGAEVTGIEHGGDAFGLRTSNGNYTCRSLALATPPSHAAGLLRASFPEVSALLSLVKVVDVESVGVVVRKGSVGLAPFAGLIPVNDIFYSVVSSDTVPDENYRGFSFHFRPGIGHEAKLKRIREVLGTERFEDVVSRRVVLPAPALGHERLINELEVRISGRRLLLAGNYFAGLAVEDCVTRSLAEFLRLKGML